MQNKIKIEVRIKLLFAYLIHVGQRRYCLKFLHDEGLCYVIYIRNNCRKCLAPDGIYLQSVNHAAK